MSNTYCRFCEITVKGLYLNCPKCGKYLTPGGGPTAPREPYMLARTPSLDPNGFELQDDGTVTSPTDNTEELRKQIVSRFLRWELPTDFSPDAGISYKPLPKHFGRPIGTNLLSSIQARQMVDFILDVVPPTMEEDEARNTTFQGIANAIAAQWGVEATKDTTKDGNHD